MTTDMLSDLIAKSPVFEGLSKRTIEEITQISRYDRFYSGELIWKQGDPGQFIIFVVSGVIELSMRTVSGLKTTIGLVFAGDIVGAYPVITQERYLGSAQVISESAEIIRFYLPLLKTETISPEIHSLIEKSFIVNERIFREKVEILTAGTAEQRLAFLMIRLASKNQKTGKGKIPLKLSRLQVAHLVDARLETVIRILSRWQREGLVKDTDTGLEIPRLEEMIKIPNLKAD